MTIITPVLIPSALASGSRLGPYEVIAAIGHGGMGEVYRARDTRLGRDVALKILPDAYAHDPERLARFSREAQVLASLTHPHIGAIYGLEEAGDSKTLVLELVEGPTLADRIAEGPIPVDEALPIARQIAEALEAAHAAGIVHRDLKPANIKLRGDGTVKVLDFGLAKAMDPASGHNSNLSLSPTITSPAMTQAGLILGTAAYMSPEQAKGKAVDRRADIWAFGAVLFEMLTGRRAFAGDEVSDVLASVLAREPQLAAIPDSVPGRVRQVLKACLQKDPRQRIHDIADVRLAMEGAFESPRAVEPPIAVIAPPASRWRLAIVVASVAVAAGLGGVAAWALKPTASAAKQHFVHRLATEAFTRTGRPVLAISSDNRHLAYVADRQIYLRNIDDPIARPVTGTNENPSSPFFSPNGEWIGFWAGSELKRVQIAGGTATTLTKAENPLGVSWTTDGTIIYAQTSGIWRVTEIGGVAEQIVKPVKGERMHAPQMLPGGDQVLFAVTTEPGESAWDGASIVVQSLSTGERTLVHKGGAYPRYLTSGHLVYVLENTLFARPFDLGSLAPRGGAVSVVSEVRRATGAPIGIAQYAISDRGTLVYISGAAQSEVDLVMLDRSGTPQVLPGSSGDFRYPRMSPDDMRIAVQRGDADDANIWIYDRAGSQLRQLTSEGGQRPVWTHDGTAITFRKGDEIWQIPADFGGVAERLPGTTVADTQGPYDWDRDGKVLLHGAAAGIHAFSPGTPPASEGGSVPVVAIPPPEGTSLVARARFSPTGPWVAYGAAGELAEGVHVFVGPFPHRPGGQRKVTNHNAQSPIWSRDGREIYVVAQGPELQVLEVLEASASAFRYSNPKPLFSILPFTSFVLGNATNYDVTKDGHFVATQPVGAKAEGTDSNEKIQIVLNWVEELKRLVP